MSPALTEEEERYTSYTHYEFKMWYWLLGCACEWMFILPQIKKDDSIVQKHRPPTATVTCLNRSILYYPHEYWCGK